MLLLLAGRRQTCGTMGTNAGSKAGSSSNDSSSQKCQTKRTRGVKFPCKWQWVPRISTTWQRGGISGRSPDFRWTSMWLSDERTSRYYTPMRRTSRIFTWNLLYFSSSTVDNAIGESEDTVRLLATPAQTHIKTSAIIIHPSKSCQMALLRQSCTRIGITQQQQWWRKMMKTWIASAEHDDVMRRFECGTFTKWKSCHLHDWHISIVRIVSSSSSICSSTSPTSPLTAMRSNSMHQALEETSHYVARIQQLEQALCCYKLNNNNNKRRRTDTSTFIYRHHHHHCWNETRHSSKKYALPNKRAWNCRKKRRHSNKRRKDSPFNCKMPRETARTPRKASRQPSHLCYIGIGKGDSENCLATGTTPTNVAQQQQHWTVATTTTTTTMVKENHEPNTNRPRQWYVTTNARWNETVIPNRTTKRWSSWKRNWQTSQQQCRNGNSSRIATCSRHFRSSSNDDDEECKVSHASNNSTELELAKIACQAGQCFQGIATGSCGGIVGTTCSLASQTRDGSTETTANGNSNHA